MFKQASYPARMSAILLLSVLTSMVLSCASGQRSIERSAAARTIYAEAAIVLEASRKALQEYSFMVIETRKLDQGAWRLSLRKTETNYYPENITSLLVEAEGAGKTRVALIPEASFWGRFKGEPAWADAFFTRIFELLP
ncbi:MAG: hypothetical protein V1742_01130 [Pseudomonadota bacterium]